MNEIIRAALELQTFCESQGWRQCLIGGLALLRWGEPRTTVDADFTLLAGFGRERPFVESLLRRFAGRITDTLEFAVENRVVLLRSQSGVGLDVSLGALPYEELVVDRSSVFAFTPEISLRTCSAEDLVILKSFAGRNQDWIDVEGVIAKQSGLLDWP